MRLLSSPPPSPRRRRGGFTIVEVCVSTCVLAIAVSGMIGSLVAATALRRVTNESALAERAAARVIEEMHGRPFADVFRAYNGWAGDDLGLTGGPAASAFAVQGLDVQPGDADGLCGEVTFPALDVAGVLQLREDLDDAALGLPRDLNLDGLVDDLDHAADHLVLPVRVRIRWRGVSGDRQLDVETNLCER
jgi:hypothetical protein